jgi:hypothetical protein
MVQHMHGRLTATTVPAGGSTTIAPPEDGEDLFLYVTDGTGQATHDGVVDGLGQYDVILGRPSLSETTIQAADDEALYFMSFYLPSFLP